MLKRSWPAIRACLVLAHVLAVVVLSFPSSYKLADRARWRNTRTQQELRLWADRLRDFGVNTTPQRLEARLWSAARVYLGVREAVASPFEPYARVVGVEQGWGMFKSPERRPVLLRIEVAGAAGEFRTVYLSRSGEHRWLAEQLDHNRLRKLVARTGGDEEQFWRIADWVARRAAREWPDATEVRVSVERFDALPPERAARGEVPTTVRERERVVPLGGLR